MAPESDVGNVAGPRAWLHRGDWHRLAPHLTYVPLWACVCGLAAGLAATAFGAAPVADVAFGATLGVGLVVVAAGTVMALARREANVDLLALFALLGTVAVGELLAGAVIAVMYTTGRALEARAAAQAEHELRALTARAPRRVHRLAGDDDRSGGVDTAIDAVAIGDLLLVRNGEVVGVDGIVAGNDTALVDESALTGEAAPVEFAVGAQVRSGGVCAGGPFRLRATTTADESTYAGIVRLVAGARSRKAPFVRVADRFALVFGAAALAVAGLAWALSGDPVRAVAVLVVATPCPLILAAPVAIVAGVSRAARRGVIVKGGGALETLGRARVLCFDKTGTLTAGHPRVTDLDGPPDADPAALETALRLAASLDQVSPHVLAVAVLDFAHARGLALSFPSEVDDVIGAGVAGVVDGSAVRVGKVDWVAAGADGSGTTPVWVRRARRRALREGRSVIAVGIDGTVAAVLAVEDPVRPDSPRTLRRLRGAGIARIVMLTGDHADVADAVGTAVGTDAVLAERSPADKVDAVTAERTNGVTLMVGDGINDAPALAAADVGVAMGARGATAASEAADVVLVVDRLERLAEAMRIAQRTRRIALQSVLAGIGLSLAAMGAAAAGLLVPVAGALVQEAIDVAVILNALRALRGPAGTRGTAPADGVALGRRFLAEHHELLAGVERIRTTADELDRLDPAARLARLHATQAFLVGVLLPHELDEDRLLYPVVARYLGGEDPTGTMHRTHAEIARLVGVLGRLIDDVSPDGPTDADLADLRRILYGLHTILRLHFAQEEGDYLSLFDTATTPAGTNAGTAAEPAVRADTGAGRVVPIQ